MSTGSPELILHGGCLDHGKYVWSPHAVKLEVRLRFAGLSYLAGPGSVNKGPKGKIPYIDVVDKEASTTTILAPESPELVREFPVGLEYAGRIHGKYFPDSENWTE